MLAGLKRWVGTLKGMDLAVLALFASASYQWEFGPDPLRIALVEPVALLVLVYLAMSGSPSLERPRAHSVAWLWAGLVVWAALQWLLASDWRYGARDVRQLLLAVLVLAALLRRQDFEPRRAVWMAIGVATVSALAADFQRLTGWFAPPFATVYFKDVLTPPTGAGVPVAVGFFTNANVFAGFIFWPLLIAVGRVIRGPQRILAAGGAILLSLSLYWSLARGVTAGALLGMLFLTIFLFVRRRRVAFGLVTALAAVTIVVVLYFGSTHPEGGFFLTLGLRRVLWDAALEMMSRTPSFLLSGVGAHGIDYLQGFALLGRYDPHNLYLYFLTHYGLAGLAVVLLTAWSILSNGWRTLRETSMRPGPVWTAIFSGWAALLVMGMLDSYFTDAPWRIWFVLMLAILLAFRTSVHPAPAEV
jgi:O-antigen ligase